MTDSAGANQNDAHGDHPNHAEPVPSIRFSIVHLLYATSVTAVSLGLLGWWGLLVALLVVVVWGIMLLSEKPGTLLLGLGAIVIFGGSCFSLLPAVSAAREAARASQCAGRFKMLALGIHNYYDLHKTLPPAMIVDADGTPMHSWRVLLLPFIEENRVYQAYNFNEPWNSPKNDILAKAIVHRWLRCPSLHEEDISTENINVVAVVGDNAAFSPDGTRRFSHYTAGTANTLMLLEINAPGVPYMKPQDLTFDETVAFLTSDTAAWNSPHQQTGFFVDRMGCRHVAMADGSVHRVYGVLSREEAVALLSTNVVCEGEIEEMGIQRQRPNVGNCFRFAAFVLIVLLPTPWACWRFFNRPVVHSGIGPQANDLP